MTRAFPRKKDKKIQFYPFIPGRILQIIGLTHFLLASANRCGIMAQMEGDNAPMRNSMFAAAFYFSFTFINKVNRGFCCNIK